MIFKKYKFDELQHRVKNMGAYPLDILVVGVTGAGKSTTMNALFGTDIAKVGDGVDPETMQLSPYRLNDYFRIWDSPGLGDGRTKDLVHSKAITDILYRTYKLDNQEYGLIDLVLVVIEGANRDMGTTYKLLNDVIVPNFQSDRIIIATNQADFAMKGRHWDYDRNQPLPKLSAFLSEQSESIKNRVYEGAGVAVDKPIYYSAAYDYNVDKLMDEIIGKVPLCRRPLVV
ncbi:50S ribosome-binding GTPase [Vibrio vulnificus]